MKTFAVIPTKFYPPQLDKYMYTLRVDIEIEQIIILDNGVQYPRVKNSKELWLNCKNMNIYQMWNEAWKMLKFQHNPNEKFNILFLNDDIEFDSHLVSIMAKALRQQDDLAVVFPDANARTRTVQWNDTAYQMEYTDTTGGAGGMTGYCFMMKGELDIPYIDENLKLYWGDDDLVKQVIKAGFKIARVVGLPILHAGSYTINRMDASERQRLMEADLAYFNRKYQESRAPV